jgi:hypothetical protein
MKQDQTPLSMKTLFQPENEAEAYAVRAMLAEQGIGAVIHSFHDSAFDGLFQSQYGWGAVKVAEGDLQKATELLAEWRDAAPEIAPGVLGGQEDQDDR